MEKISQPSIYTSLKSNQNCLTFAWCHQQMAGDGKLSTLMKLIKISSDDSQLFPKTDVTKSWVTSHFPPDGKSCWLWFPPSDVGTRSEALFNRSAVFYNEPYSVCSFAFLIRRRFGAFWRGSVFREMCPCEWDERLRAWQISTRSAVWYSNWGSFIFAGAMMVYQFWEVMWVESSEVHAKNSRRCGFREFAVNCLERYLLFLLIHGKSVNSS